MTDSENLVHRGTSSDKHKDVTSETSKQPQSEPVEDKSNFHFVYTIAKVLIIFTVISVLYTLYSLSYSDTPSTPRTPSKVTNTKGPHFGDPKLTGRLYTREELARHDSHGSPILLAIMGRVYDVTKSRSYQPDGGYPFFAGTDGTRAFATGEFNDKGLIDDITELDHDSIRSIADWVFMYDEDYPFVGKLIGTYFDEKGDPTAALMNAEKLLKKANKQKATQNKEKVKFPPCNGR